MLERYSKFCHTPEEFEAIACDLAPKLQFSFGLNKIAILMGLAGVETSMNKNNRPRFEPVYSIGGKYFHAQQMQKLWDLYGDAASMSYGPWQILAIKAYELGYFSHPVELWDGKISGPFVVMNLNNIFKSGAQSIEQILDAYNTGSFRVGEPPQSYIARFWNAYGEVAERLINKKEEGETKNG